MGLEWPSISNRLDKSRLPEPHPNKCICPEDALRSKPKSNPLKILRKK